MPAYEEAIMTNPMFALGEIAILAVATTDLSRVGEEREIRGLPAPIWLAES
jgi:hypothetical protein